MWRLVVDSNPFFLQVIVAMKQSGKFKTKDAAQAEDVPLLGNKLN